MSIISRWLKSKRNKARRGRRFKIVGFSGLAAIHHRMTNWQNSQWMRAGGPALRTEDEQLASAKHFVTLERRK